METIYWSLHYADEKPREVNAEEILVWAEDEGKSFESVEEAIAFLNDIGDAIIWAGQQP